MLRGNNGQDIFQSDADRSRLCLLIQEGVVRYGFKVVAFCFMTNHLHLAVEVEEISLSEIFQTVAGRYSRYFNRKYETRGHLFQARFQSLLVGGEIYLRHLIRYIHLNPVRAGLAEAPQDYRWSSHSAYLDQTAFAWLAKERGLKYFGRSKEEQISHYNDFVLGGIGQEELIDFLRAHREGILGGEVFIDQVAKQTKLADHRKKITVESLLDVVGRHYKCEPASLQAGERDLRSSHVRAMTAYLAKEVRGVTLEELAVYFGQGASSVSKGATRITRKLLDSPDVRDELNALRNALYS